MKTPRPGCQPTRFVEKSGGRVEGVRGREDKVRGERGGESGRVYCVDVYELNALERIE